MIHLKNSASALVATMNEIGFQGRKILEAFVDGGDASCDHNNVSFTVSFADDGVPVNDLAVECRRVLGWECNLEIFHSINTAYILAHR